MKHKHTDPRSIILVRRTVGCIVCGEQFISPPREESDMTPDEAHDRMTHGVFNPDHDQTRHQGMATAALQFMEKELRFPDNWQRFSIDVLIDLHDLMANQVKYYQEVIPTLEKDGQLVPLLYSEEIRDRYIGWAKQVSNHLLTIER